MRTLIIDNYDSFTYNLMQCLGQLGGEPTVHRNDEITIEEIRDLDPTHIVISPGPGTPADGGVSEKVIRAFGHRIPTLGVCLGHQIIAHFMGARVCRAPAPVHGKDCQVFHTGKGTWKGLAIPFSAGRYHSLIVERSSLPSELLLTAWTECGLVMGVRHQSFPLIGVQFHPESILTPAGMTMLSNFLETPMRRATAHAC